MISLTSTILSPSYLNWAKMPTVHLLDYVAGNVRSLVNAIEEVGFTVEWIKEPKDIETVDVGAQKVLGVGYVYDPDANIG